MISPVMRPCLGVALATVIWSLAASASSTYGELRGYPTGVIASAGALFAKGSQDELGVSVLYNRAHRGDAGRHDDESGEGFGIGFEGRRFYTDARLGWFYGLRAELFQLDLEWRDPGNRRGSTDITVLQPTARIGYRLPLAGSQTSVEIAGGLGAEINLKTKGEQVGEGAIGLIGLALRFD